MQQVFHGNCALFGDFVAAQQRQNASLARASRRRMMHERQATSTTIATMIGAPLIEVGARIGETSAARLVNLLPITG